MTENTDGLFDYGFTSSLASKIQRDLKKTAAVAEDIHDSHGSTLGQIAGVGGMVVGGIKAAKDVRAYQKVKNSINRAIRNAYVRAAESVGDFSSVPGEMRSLARAYGKYQNAYESWKKAWDIGYETGFSSNEKQLSKEWRAAKSELAREMRKAAPLADKGYFQPQRGLLDRARMLETVVKKDGYINAAKMLKTSDASKIIDKLTLEADFGSIEHRFNLIKANPRLRTSAVGKFMKSGGKGFVPFAIAYELYAMSTPNAEQVDEETLKAMTDMYDDIAKKMGEIPDKYDYEHTQEEKEALVEWALKSTTNEEEKEMLNALKGNRCNYDFYKYMKDRYYLNEEFWTSDEVSPVVFEEMVSRISSNVNGGFYAKLEMLRDQRLLEKNQELEKGQKQEPENTGSSVTQTLLAAENAAEVQGKPVTERAWQAEEVKVEQDTATYERASKESR